MVGVGVVLLMVVDGSSGLDGSGGSGVFRSGGGGLFRGGLFYDGRWHFRVGWGFCGDGGRSGTACEVRRESSLVVFEWEGRFVMFQPDVGGSKCV